VGPEGVDMNGLLIAALVVTGVIALVGVAPWITYVIDLYFEWSLEKQEQWKRRRDVRKT
jgi:hypothetical protein